MVVDLENMYMATNREENLETKQVYIYLFNVSNYRFVYFLMKKQITSSF